MTIRVLEYCTRAVIRHLDGDIDAFKDYVEMAKIVYENQKNIATIGELMPEEIQKQLYVRVS